MSKIVDDGNEKLHYYNSRGEIEGICTRTEAHFTKLIHKHVCYFVTNEKNELFLQLRSKEKLYNPNQWDKPGGHLTVEDTLVTEFLEEICYDLKEIDAVIVNSNNYKKAIKSNDLKKIVVLTKIKTLLNYTSKRLTQEQEYIDEIIHLEIFKGKYYGPVNPHPAEVQKIMPWTERNINYTIKEHPVGITYDTQRILSIYADKIFRE